MCTAVNVDNIKVGDEVNIKAKVNIVQRNVEGVLWFKVHIDNPTTHVTNDHVWVEACNVTSYKKKPDVKIGDIVYMRDFMSTTSTSLYCGYFNIRGFDENQKLYWLSSNNSATAVNLFVHENTFFTSFNYKVA